MTFAQQADQWPAYDGLGDEEDDELPPQEGDDESDLSLDNLEDWLVDHPTGLPFFDDFVQQTLRWLHEELETEALVGNLKDVRATLLETRDPLPQPIRRSLLRLKHALEADDGEIALHVLMQLSDELGR